MKEWLEEIKEINECIREGLPIMMLVTWILVVIFLLRGLYTGAIR